MYDGYFNVTDTPNLVTFTGGVGYSGFFDVSDSSDSSHQTLTTGYLYDSTSLTQTLLFYQNQILQLGDLSLTLADRTYQGGYWDGTTLRDGTMIHRWYDPIWINSRVCDASGNVVGYPYRAPVRKDVGQYYMAMEAPQRPGKYSLRWRYQKDSSSYAREIIQPFDSASRGIDSDRT